MKKKVVYVTGCFGFIGSHFTRECLDRGWLVYGVDKITYAANEEVVKEFFRDYENFKLIEKDINDLDRLEDCDYVINFAAESHVENSISNNSSFVDTNINGVRNLLELIRLKHANVHDRPVLLHISTDEVYGDIEYGYHLETDLLKPSNPYSATKAAADMLINAWGRTYGLDYIIARPTNNYGTHQYPEKLIPITVKNLARGKKIKLHNKGKPIRTWLHVLDTVSALMTILKVDETEPEKTRNQIFNISGGQEIQNLDVVSKIIKNIEKTDNIKKYVDFSYSRQGQDVRYAIDDSKIRGLGWLPTREFDSSLLVACNFYYNRFKL